jgi:hypothetical protein
MRKFLVYAITSAGLFLMASSCSYADEVWNLVHSDYRAPNWYCTYQLYGSTAYTTTVVLVNNPQTDFCPTTFTKH